MFSIQYFGSKAENFSGLPNLDFLKKDFYMEGYKFDQWQHY